MRALAVIVFGLLCLNVAGATFAVAIDVEAFLATLDIEIYVTAVLIALPLARVISTWITPRVVEFLKHELIIWRMCFDSTYEIPEHLRLI